MAEGRTRATGFRAGCRGAGPTAPPGLLSSNRHFHSCRVCDARPTSIPKSFAGSLLRRHMSNSSSLSFAVTGALFRIDPFPSLGLPVRFRRGSRIGSCSYSGSSARSAPSGSHTSSVRGIVFSAAKSAPGLISIRPDSFRLASFLHWAAGAAGNGGAGRRLACYWLGRSELETTSRDDG
jgi:hypothetical protein